MSDTSNRFQDHLSALAQSTIKQIQSELGEYSEYKAISVIIEFARQNIQQSIANEGLDNIVAQKPRLLSSLQTLVSIIKPEALQVNQSLSEQIEHFVAEPFADFSISPNLENKIKSNLGCTILQTVVYLGASIANSDFLVNSQTYTADSPESLTASTLLEQVPDLDLEASLTQISKATELSVTERLFAQLYECNRLIDSYSDFNICPETFSVEQYFLFNAYTGFKLINKPTSYPAQTESISPLHFIFLDVLITNPILVRHLIVDIVEKVQKLWVQQFVQVVMETSGEKKIYEILEYCQQKSPETQAEIAHPKTLSQTPPKTLSQTPPKNLSQILRKNKSTQLKIAAKPPKNSTIILLCYQSLGHEEFVFILESQMQQHYTRLIQNLSRIVPIRTINCLIMLSLALDIDAEHRVDHVLNLKKILEELLAQESEKVTKLVYALFKLILESKYFYEVFQEQYPELINIH